MMRDYLLALFVLFGAMNLYAQSEAAVNVSQGGYGLVRTNMSVGYDRSWSTVRDCFDARVSYEFLTKRLFTLTANARYTTTATAFDASDLSGGFSPDGIGLNGTHSFGQIGITSTLRARFLGRPFLGMAMVNSEWGAGGFARVSGIAMGLIMLRANERTQFGLGPLVLVNSCSRIPAFLVFMYRHRFNSRWMLNLYGGVLGIDYTPTRSDLISIGADIDVKAFYFRPHDENLPSRCRFTSTSFRPGVKYRRQLVRNLYCDIHGGLSVRMSCRVNGVTGTHEWIKCHRKPSPFIHASISYAL